MVSGPEYVTVDFYQWSMGLLVTSVVGTLIVFAKRLFCTPTREEMIDANKILADQKEKEHNIILSSIEKMSRENKESLQLIRDAVTRLENGYFVRFHKSPGDERER